jgi:hypothetical protein
MSTRTRWLGGAAGLVVAVIAVTTVVQLTEQDEPLLVEVPCSQQQIKQGVEKCYDADAIKGATQLEEFTLICNSLSDKKEAKLRARSKGGYCGDDVPDIPEDQEWAAGVRLLP